MYLDKKFFKQYKRQLTWFANTKLGKLFFGFKKMGHTLDGYKIVEIHPNSITQDIGNGKLRTQFFSRPEYSYRVNRLFEWLPLNAIKRIELDGQWLLQPKLGLTTSTFYPAVGANSPVDGRLNETGTSWADNRAAEEAGSVEVTTSNDIIVQSEYTAVNKPISRCAFCFNTAALSTEDISSAYLSIYSSKSGNNSETNYPADLAVVSVDLDSTDDLIAADYAIANWGSTRFTASDYDLGTFIASVGYKNFTLNSAGVLNILKTGVSQFGIRAANDIDNNTPTARSYGFGYYADETGTAKDPKLVVEHEAAPEPDHGSQDVIFFD